MTGEPKCPECGTTVLPDWDWCEGCGFDPDGLRSDVAATAAPRAASVAAGTGSLPPLFELDVNQKTLGKKHLMITADRVVYGKSAVELAKVTGYSWSRAEKACEITLDAPGGDIHVRFGVGQLPFG